jgi:hypothetical protein
MIIVNICLKNLHGIIEYDQNYGLIMDSQYILLVMTKASNWGSQYLIRRGEIL